MSILHVREPDREGAEAFDAHAAACTVALANEKDSRAIALARGAHALACSFANGFRRRRRSLKPALRVEMLLAHGFRTLRRSRLKPALRANASYTRTSRAPTVLSCLLAFIILCTTFAHPLPVLSLRAEDERIELLTNQILRKEIDFERFYLHYRVSGTKQPKFRRMRYFLLQCASASCGIASSTTFLKLAADSLRTGQDGAVFPGDSDADFPPQDKPATSTSDTDDVPGETTTGASSNESSGSSSSSPPPPDDDSSNKVAKNALILGMMGVLLDATTSAIELSSNGLLAAKNIMQKRSPGAAVKSAVARLGEVDALMKERDGLISKHSNESIAAVYRSETRVLKAFRDWCLSEFADVYADVKSAESSCNVYYLLDLAADSMYLTSYILALKALRPGSRTGVPSVNFGIVGDCLGMSCAPANAAAQKIFSKYWRNRLKKNLKEELKNTESEAKVALSSLVEQMKSTSFEELSRTTRMRDRVAAYALWSARYDRYIDKQLVDLRHQSKTALQGELSGPAISGTFLAQDIMSRIALRRLSRPKEAAALALAGSTASLTGVSASLFLNNWFLLDEIKHRRRLRKNNLLPEQLLAERLKTLDELDRLIISKGRNSSTM